MGKGFVAFFRLEALHPRKVPGYLQVVTNDTTGLMNAPGEIMGPVIIELLVHKRAIAVVREVFADGVECVF